MSASKNLLERGLSWNHTWRGDKFNILTSSEKLSDMLFLTTRCRDYYSPSKGLSKIAADLVVVPGRYHIYSHKLTGAFHL